MRCNDCYIGLMSGTSADAIDAVAVDFSTSVHLVGHHSLTLPPALRTQIHQLTIPGHDEINRTSVLDRHLGDLSAECVLALLEKINLSSTDIRAIGSHGQTIRHHPTSPQTRGYTLQIGDPNIIANTTGITTIADFRRRDIAAGGQGAPLVPAFHRALFSTSEVNRVIINIGGIANITWLPTTGEVIGFDTGPGNTLMDAWIGMHLGSGYDANGDWAGSGSINQALLKSLLEHSFFTQQPPKSTGREAFNLAWLVKILEQAGLNKPEDIQATLLELTAKTIALNIEELANDSATELFVCGGGAYNSRLMARLAALLPHYPLETTQKLGVAPEWVEAMAFAWLARQTLNRMAGNLCSVTGAEREVILGGIYFAQEGFYLNGKG